MLGRNEEGWERKDVRWSRSSMAVSVRVSESAGFFLAQERSPMSDWVESEFVSRMSGPQIEKAKKGFLK